MPRGVYDRKARRAAVTARAKSKASVTLTPINVKLPKRLDLQEVRELLGDAAADKLLTVYLRKKAAAVHPVTEADLENALAALKGAPGKPNWAALGKISLKHAADSVGWKSGLIRYINNLLKEITDEE